MFSLYQLKEKCEWMGKFSLSLSVFRLGDARRPDSPLCAASHVNIPSAMFVLQRVPQKNNNSSVELPVYTAEAKFPVRFWPPCLSSHLIYSKWALLLLCVSSRQSIYWLMEIFRDTHKPNGCRRSLSLRYACSVGFVGNLKSTQDRVKIKTQFYTETVAWNILYYDSRELTYLASGIWTNTFLLLICLSLQVSTRFIWWAQKWKHISCAKWGSVCVEGMWLKNKQQRFKPFPRNRGEAALHFFCCCHCPHLIQNNPTYTRTGYALG